MALTTLKSLDAEIKLLEAQKKLVEKRDGEVPKALAVIQKYAKVLTAAQRRQLAKLVGEDASIVPAAGPKAARTSLKGRKLGKVAPKYRLPSGETWTGRGLMPKVFAAWLKSPEGKAWAGNGSGERFPPASAGQAQAKTLKRVKGKVGDKPTKTARKKAAGKVAKKVVKKAARKPAGRTKKA
ncbi:H-NS histone family protein [Stenotrophomonas maltophilia]|uniref:H-NS histone family protein n=1 Tax=Stenotrophomonas maltophilia TaxID=40324 RepID=UPI0015DD3A03|nr:H-NS histone family protein [Stenotrophomonas maltophilia]USA16235.1 H-NS histone family protein [Stenotrophomonas maltophilia]BBQ13552.1 hypothetical protein WP1W18C01_39120 [Stenotrophomonas maltophilia]